MAVFSFHLFFKIKEIFQSNIGPVLILKVKVLYFNNFHIESRFVANVW